MKYAKRESTMQMSIMLEWMWEVLETSSLFNGWQAKLKCVLRFQFTKDYVHEEKDAVEMLLSL